MTKRKLDEKVQKAHSGALPGVIDLGVDQAMGHYEWGKKVAGHDGKKQTSPNPSMGAFKDKPIAVGYTKAETQMAKAASGGKAKNMTTASSKEASDTHTKSPVRKVSESDIRAELAQYRIAEGSKKDDGDKPFNYDEWKKSGQKPRRPRGAGFADAWEKEQAKDKAKERGVAEGNVIEADQVDPYADPNAQPAPAEQPPVQTTSQATADTVLDQLPELVTHAKERKVLDPNYNKQALASDIAEKLGVEATNPLVAKVVRFISTTEKISESFKDQVRGDDEAKPMGRVLGSKPKKHPYAGRLVGEGDDLEASIDKLELDVPLMIRMLEYAREDAKTDMELHKVVERMLSLDKPLSMDDYHSIVSNLDEDAMVEHIVKVKGGYELKSKKTGKNLGKYPTKAGAEKRERQVQYFKHMGESTLKDKEDLDAKRKALQDIQMDPNTHKDPELKAELAYRKAALEKEAKAMGLVKESLDSIRNEFYSQKGKK